jgi:transcriptional regulator with XRE-family HTH domain
MNSGPTTSVDQARDALGKRLRELRKQAGLTGKQLAESLSWPASKISKLENSRQTPTDGDLRAWATVTGSEAEADSLLAALHTLELQHAEWNRLLKSGLRAHQTTLRTHDEKVKLYRAVETSIIHGLMQTPEYAREIFIRAAALRNLSNDVEDAVRIRMQRQEILYRSDKRFHFILTEAALHYRRAPVDVMLAQLDRLVAISSLRNVRLGIIDFKTMYVTTPKHGFWILDDDLVRVETHSAELNLQQPQEIEIYRDIFERHAAVASYDGAARAIITRVMQELSAEADETGA